MKVTTSSLLSDETHDKSNNRDDGENEEQDFSNFNRTSRNTTEAENGSNKCYDQKNY